MLISRLQGVRMVSLRAMVLGALLASLFLLVTPQRSSAATTASDNFNRANGSLGANWTDMTVGGLAISGDNVIGTQASGNSGDIYTGATFASDQSSQVQVTSTPIGGGQWIGPAVRAQNGGQSLYVGIYFGNNGSPVLDLFKLINGSWTQLGSSFASGTLAAGTELTLSVTGSTLSFSENGVVEITATDTSLTGGAPGIMAYGTATAGDWVGASASTTTGGTFSIGGTVSGLSGTVSLENNGGDLLNIAANGTFTFASQLAQGASYAVTVSTEPSGQVCSVTNGSGVVGSANVTNVSVTCATPGGTGSGPTTASDNFNRANGSLGANWTDMTVGGLAISGDNVIGTQASGNSGDIYTGATFASDQSSQVQVTSTPIGGGQWIGPAVRAQNGGQSLYVGIYFGNNGSPVLDLFKLINGSWTQLGSSFASGTLAAGTELTLSVTGSTLSFSENGVVEITATDTSLTGGAPGIMAYGTATAGDWVGASASTTTGGTFSIGGTVSGLSGTVSLENNGGDLLNIAANGTFTFASQLAQGASYAVTVSTEPSGQVCSVTNGSGVVGSANVTNVSVTCATPGGTGSGPYSIGGTVSGLSGTAILEDNGGNAVSVSANGTFTFTTLLAAGTDYAVTVSTDPSGQACTVTNGTGTVASANVTNVSVSCGSGAFSIHYVSTDANNIESYSFTSANDGDGPQTLRVLLPTHPAAGVAHNFLYVLPVEAGLGDVFGDGLETMAALDAEDQYNLTIVEPTFAIDPWYANNPNDANLQYETFMTNELEPWVQANLSTTGTEQNWLIGFSKSGLGAQDLILKHPNLFQLAASWDFPADMTSYDQLGTDPAANYGTDANYQANYNLTNAFLATYSAPFLASNRIWIGGYYYYQYDVTDYDSRLTSEGIAHTLGPMVSESHTWTSGWVPGALAGLYEDSTQLGSSAPTDTLTFNSEGGSAVANVSGVQGSTVTLPAAPTLAGYAFAGWFTAATGGTAVTSPYTLTASTTLYAQWTTLVPVTVNVSGSQSYGGSSSFTYATTPSGVSINSLKCTKVGTSTAINSSLTPGSYTILGSSCSGGAIAGDVLTFVGTANGFVVAKGAQTVKFTSTAPTKALVGGTTYTAKASATSGLTTTITVDSSASAVCAVAGGVVSFQKAGTCLLDANQAGNVDYNAATQVQQSFAVSSVPVFAIDTPPTTATVGHVYTYTFSANGTPTPTYSLSTAAPTWLSINSTTGVLQGTPPSGTKTFSYSVIATNSAGKATAGSFKVQVST